MVHNPRIGSRPHVQGDAAPLRLRHSAQNLTDGGGLGSQAVGPTRRGRLGRPTDARDRGPLSIEPDRQGLDRPAAVRGRGAGRSAAAGSPPCPTSLRLKAGTGSDKLSPLASAGRTDAGAAARWAPVADRSSSLGRGGSARARHARARLDGIGALWRDPGGSRARLQSEEAGPTVASSAAGLRPADRRLPRCTLATGQCTHGSGGRGLVRAPSSGRPPASSGACGSSRSRPGDRSSATMS